MRKLALVFALIPLPAFAGAWDVDVAHSSLAFSGRQGSEVFHGHFTKFTPVIDFDPAAPQNGHIAVTIDMTSVAVDGKDRQDAIGGSDWFNSSKFAQASYVSKTISTDGRGGFTADGTLTLKGVAKPAKLAFTLDTKDGITHAKGTASLQRNDFNVGTGDYSSNEWIAYPVDVSFDLAAKPASAPAKP